MRVPNENAVKANNSTLTSTLAHVTGNNAFRATSRNCTQKAPTLNVTGASTNPYLYAIRKAFREYIGDEGRGRFNAILVLDGKLKAARLLFPEDRANLHKSLVLESQVQALTIKTA